ncbi:hypothetical protein Murru_1104 [Allomuricauda ruestringensis DSM 13258]|uniref:Lipoprotein n=1 Tax=Allomuricauda ruestringensis (strain DSM 13258 / CIP 107369 / LMG 19739 / B1) TaxID=886377 RepID=G2PMP1_ALLRU|nr:hypothetical protein [Allomuricauda ruestringensis]AEM70148.1 hypothetical protein Murru_1104 [Allomuricauda ruestringensis DSM 13258]
MKKLTLHLPTILIGLSIFLFSGCILTEMDPPEKWAVVKFLNSSNQDIVVKMIGHPLSADGSDIVIHIDAMKEEGSNKYVYGENAIDAFFSIIGENNTARIEVHIGNDLVKEWTGLAENFGPDVNSPFNYDSWQFQKIEPTGNNIVGKIIFTITNEDIGN